MRMVSRERNSKTKERRENCWSSGPSCEQEGKEPCAQKEGLPQEGAWAGQEESRAVPGKHTGWQATVVVSMGKSILLVSLFSMIYM